MLSIGVRYCGGCNPQIDRSRVIRDLSDALKRMGLKVDFTTDRERAVDIVLLINGCMHACLEGEYLRGAHDHQRISVRGKMVDDQRIEEDHIPGLLAKKICSSPFIPPLSSPSRKFTQK
jgi:hypothetical protein